jgi:hypothetical protein
MAVAGNTIGGGFSSTGAGLVSAEEACFDEPPPQAESINAAPEKAAMPRRRKRDKVMA